MLVADRQLEVVAPANPQYLATAYAPVMFGRSTSALHDVPLLVDATATPAGGGTTQLSYTFIWSHEDAGTGFVPFLEWGTWGRMTDIENAIAFTVAADGSHVGGHLPMGRRARHGIPGQPGRAPGGGRALHRAVGRPSPDPAGRHRQQRLLGWPAPHRSGSSWRRYPAPAAGQTRESVMDAHPFTYQVSGQEVARWYGDISTDPRSPEPGDARQYATIDLDASGSGVSLARRRTPAGG